METCISARPLVTQRSARVGLSSVRFVLETLEVHEGGRPVGRPVAAELDRAHLAAQVTLADRLYLKEGRQR
jgi:hypothetical protein